VYVYTHKKLSIAYNQKHIVEVNLTSEDPQLVKEGAVFDFRYDVTWVDKPSQSFDKRFERYLDYSFFEHQIHWFSIFNSFMMVIFLVGLVTLILIRTLRNDYAKYMRDEEDLDETERGVGEESGWKQVHGDVFRTPPHLTLFTALYGAGHQLLLLFLLFIFLSIAASLYVERGAVVTTFIVCYGVTSAWAGYMSGSFYKHHFYRDSPGTWKGVGRRGGWGGWMVLFVVVGAHQKGSSNVFLYF
jgi:transmembrane 9 superfamily protein 3